MRLVISSRHSYYLALTSVCERVCARMHLEILNTFLTAIADDGDDGGDASSSLRCHSAPPAVRYKDRAFLPAEPKTARSRQRKKKDTKAHKANLAAAAAAADEATFTEFAAKVVEERLQACEPEQSSATVARRSERRLRSAAAEGRATYQDPLIRLRIRFHGPDEERPLNAIFLLQENVNAEIGVVYDPNWSTTELRERLLGINGCEQNDGAVVTTIEGRVVPAGSTIGEQNVMPGARLRLARANDMKHCAQC